MAVFAPEVGLCRAILILSCCLIKWVDNLSQERDFSQGVKIMSDFLLALREAPAKKDLAMVLERLPFFGPMVIITVW